MASAESAVAHGRSGLVASADVVAEPDEGMQRWLLQRYKELGCTPDEALSLLLAEIDWHDLDRLLKGGCDMRLAVRILA